MTVEEAVQIVTSFGGIAEISAITGSDAAASLSMLPYPVEVIEIAIETYMDNLIKTRTYSEKARAYLKTGYTMLASFVPDEQVKVVHAGEKALADSVRKQAEAGGETGGEDEDWDSVNKSSAILTKIQQEMSQRQEAINKYELQQLLAHAAG